jgi:flagellin
MADSLYAANRVARVDRSSRQTMRKLSSGVRLTSAADGAADLGISEKIRAHVRSERDYLSTEYEVLKSDIDRVTRASEFNGLKIVPGATDFIAIQVGIHQKAIHNQVRVRLLPANASSLGVSVTGIGAPGDAQMALRRLDTAIDVINETRAGYGANQNQLSAAYRNLETWTENMVDTESRIRDTDIAIEAASLTRQQVFRRVGIAMLSQTGTSRSAALALLG